MTSTRQQMDRMAELLDKARSAGNPAIAVEYLAQIQRLSGHALRAAVADSMAEGQVDWHWLAAAAQTPPGTLRAQYEGGGRIVIHDPCTPTEANYDAKEEQ